METAAVPSSGRHVVQWCEQIVRFAYATQVGREFELCKAKGMSKGLFGFEDYAAMFDEENPKPLTRAYQTQFKLDSQGTAWTAESRRS